MVQNMSGGHKGSKSVITEDALGVRVRAARVGADMTQAALAEAIGVDQPTVSRLEAGKDFSSLLLKQIAAATGRDLGYFFRNDDAADPEVFLRADDAQAPAVKAAIADLSEFVRDYEFLLELVA